MICISCFRMISCVQSVEYFLSLFVKQINNPTELFKSREAQLSFIINSMNGKNLALLLAILGAAAVLFNQQTATKVSEFQAYKTKFGVEFASEFENVYREKIFLENLNKINAHNSNQFRTYEQGVNQFSHLTQEQFVQQYLGLIVKAAASTIESTDDLKVGDTDWVAQGFVTPVKNQGQCGSCWAFSATGGLEGLSKANGELQSFSEQQLVDCSGSFGNQACNGGLMDNAFKYVKANGIALEAAYPYKAVKQTCNTKVASEFKIGGFVDIKNCNDLASAIAGRPISVAVDATNWSPYKSGIFSNCKTSLNHGVLLVGISDQHWWVKNSWGAAWGESGFIRLARGNTCGICNVASYPTK